jgi:hypothetical protein
VLLRTVRAASLRPDEEMTDGVKKEEFDEV